MAKIRFKLKAHTKKVRQIKLDTDSLLIPAVLDSYRDSLHSLLPASLDDLNIETAWSSIRNEISAAATRPLPKKGPAHKPWLSPKSLAFIAKRANCRSRKMMKSVRKTVEKSVRANKVAYFRRLADEVQAVDEIGNTRIVYKTIRSISGKRSRCSEVLKNSNGKAIADSNEKIEEWAAYFGSLLNNPANDSADINPRVSDVLAKVKYSVPVVHRLPLCSKH